MWAKKVLAIILLSSILITQTGCWNNTDITRLAIATAVGIDKAGSNKYLVSVQIIKVQSQGSGQSDGGSTQGEDTIVLTGKGETIFEAIRNILNSIGRKIFYSNVQAIVIGEDVAKQGLTDILDFFERQHETQLKTYMLVAKGCTAEEVLSSKSDIENIPAVNIAQIVENSKYRLNICRTTLLELLIDLREEGKQPVIGMIKTISPKIVRIEGTAVFQGDKMVGELSPDETRGYELLTREIQDGIIIIPNPKDPKRYIEIELANSSPKINFKMADGKPEFKITIKNDASIAEIQGSNCLSSKEDIQKLEESYKNEVKNEAEKTIEVLQTKLESDVLGLGEYIHKHKSGYWHGVKGDWQKEFCEAHIAVDVEAEISRTGQIGSKKK